MMFVDDKQQKPDESTKNHATKIRITSTTRHQKCFSMSNTKVKARTTLRSGQHDAYLDETLELGVAVRRELLFAKCDDVLFDKCHRVHIYSPETWTTIQTNVSISDSISNSNGTKSKDTWPTWPKRSCRSRFVSLL